MWDCMWDLPRLGNEPVSPALADGFFTIEQPGKPRGVFFFFLILIVYSSFSLYKVFAFFVLFMKSFPNTQWVRLLINNFYINIK